MDTTDLKINDELEVTVEKLVYGGEGLARANERVIFIPNSAPGDRLRVRVNAIEKRVVRAEIIEIIQSSELRRTPPCPYFGVCGGCQLQHLPYPDQLTAKADFIRDSLRRIGHIDWPAEIEVKPGPELGYRSRVQFKVARETEPLQIGFYRAGTHEVIDIEHCPISLPKVNQALTKLRQHRQQIKNSIIPYTKIEVAVGEDNIAAHPAIAEYNDEPVEQSAFGIRYRFDAQSFFQVNRLMLETLVATAVGQRQGTLAVDLYAGVGLFSLQLARRFQRVIASEVNKRAVQYAQQNIANNQFTNIEYQDLSTERWLSKNAQRLKNVDLVLLDPPRAGVEKNALANLITLAPKEIVYVSCDPATLSRDLRVLTANSYQLQTVTGVDLFPQSYHIETVATLERKR